ncbi:MAG: DNA polymerase III subunit gamma/tau [Phascolarctobacterium sp.]
MAYVALYRQWRPQNFETLVGQQPVKQALTNALSSGRIAHAYLFAGPRGTGKTSTARILAKALNCKHGPTPNPCGVCDNCRRIAEGSSMDVFEIDAASNRGIDEIKTLRDQLAFTPVDCRYKVYIIDEVHMLTTEAFNALLKTLEEPPSHVIFILATTDPHKIPATIHSRCQRFDFRRVTVDEIAQHLAMVAQGSGLDAEEEALRLIAIQSEGGMRDALSLLDQCGVMAKKITAATVREVLGIVGREALRDLVRAIGKQDVPSALAQLSALLEQGKDVRQILAELVEYLRALLLFKAVPQYNEVYLTDTAVSLGELAALYSTDRIMASEERLHAALQELRGTMRPRITAELCLLDLCRREGSALASLTARVESLERQLAAGAAAPAYGSVQATAYNAASQAVAAPSQQQAVLTSAPQQVLPTPTTQPKPIPQHLLYSGPEEQFVEPDEGVPSAEELAQLSATPPAAMQSAQPRGSAPAATQRAAAPKQAAPVTPEVVAPQSPAVATPKTAAPKATAAQVAGSGEPAPAASSATNATIEEFGGDYAAGEDFWQQTLELVRSEKKMSMHSCAKSGRVYSFANDLLVVAFKSAFQSQRMQKPDFREYFEGVLLRVARRPIRLQCEAEAELKKRSGGAKPKAAAPQVQPVAEPKAQPIEPGELPENLQRAMNALGGTITKVN